MKMSRVEQILEYALGRETSLPNPLSRVEQLLIELIYEIKSNETQTSVKIGGRVDTISNLPLTADEGTLYFVGNVSDVNKAEYIMTADGNWELLGYSSVDIDMFLSGNSNNPVANSVITSAINGRVEKVLGKGLSTNDFTDEYKSFIDDYLDDANKYPKVYLDIAEGEGKVILPEPDLYPGIYFNPTEFIGAHNIGGSIACLVWTASGLAILACYQNSAYLGPVYAGFSFLKDDSGAVSVETYHNSRDNRTMKIKLINNPSYTLNRINVLVLSELSLPF